MGRYVQINKHSEAIGIHYYSVISFDHPEIEKFYIGLDITTQQIFFYQNSIEDSPAIIVDIEGKLQYAYDAAKDWIPKWLVFLCWKKSRDAMLARDFPPSISFQS